MSDNIEKIKTKIRALLNKTVENGCSEAEALSAVAMANRLMMEYNVAQFDLSVKDDTFHQVEVVVPGAKTHFIHNLTMAISRLTNTKVWFVRVKSKNGNSHFKYFFFGMDSDPEMAVIIFNHLKLAIDSAVANYNTRQRGDVHGSTLRASFGHGMTSRIWARIMEIVAENNAARLEVSNSKALIVVKDQLVTDAFAKKNMKLKTETKKIQANNHSAFSAGKAAGNVVDIQRRGITGGASVLALR